jgi:hypothetical protein
LMMPATLLSVSREFPTLPPFVTDRNNGPSVMEVACSQFFTGPRLAMATISDRLALKV